jgi:HK97 family phage prohead protease
MERKFWTSRFEVKDVDVATGHFRGRASVYDVIDSYGDRVKRGAFRKWFERTRGKIVVLNQHKADDPIALAQLTDSFDALWAEGQIETRLQSGREMVIKLQSGLIDGISIGYQIPEGGDRMVNGIRELHEIDLWEISLVTFPANTEARVTDVKQQRDFDAALRQLSKNMRRVTMSPTEVALDRLQESVAKLTQF